MTLHSAGTSAVPHFGGPAVHLNLNVRGLRPSATVAINERSRQLQAEGRTIYRFGLGQSPFPVPRDVVEALRENAHQKDYLAVRGCPPLREAVAGFHRRVDQVEIAPEDVLVGPGSKELMFLVQLAYYGDLVVPAPCWVSYAPQARIIGRHVRFVPTTFADRWRLLPAAFEELCADDPSRPRLLILNYPGNPDGSTYNEAELREIAVIARKYQVLLLSDEIYGRLHHEGQHVSVARFYPEGTIISHGLSKWAGAGGWRLGTFAFPPTLRWLRDALASLASETCTSTAAPIQFAAARAYDGGEAITRYLEHSRRVLRALGNWAADKLQQAGARLHRPQGAFYLFPDFEPLRDRLVAHGLRNSRQLCERLLNEAGVAILPGEDFGMWPESLTARLAYVDFDGAQALHASEETPADQALDEAWLRATCQPTVAGVEALCDWFAALA